MDINAKLAQINLVLPSAPKPVGAYVPAMRTGNLVVVSGQIPIKDGQLLAVGPVPSKISVLLAQNAARQCVLNGLAIIGEQIEGDWSRLVRIVRLGVFVNSDDDFQDQAQVANGASELLVDLFGDLGRHARAAVGVNTLPLGVAVEVEMMAEIR